jgi:hypothetical protein
MKSDETKYNIPEMEAIAIEVGNNIKTLGPKTTKGKAFESVCHSWICNKDLADFNLDDTDGNSEFGIDSINIEKKDNGRYIIRILSCKYSGGFSYIHVDKMEKGLRKIFYEGGYKALINENLRKKIEKIREIKSKIQEVKIYYCVNSGSDLDESDNTDECVKSKKYLLEELASIFDKKYSKDVSVNFSFFNAKAIYEKRIRNENPLSKRDDIRIKYKENINEFSKNKKVDLGGGKIEGGIITVSAIELKRLLKECGDWIFHYNIRKFKGENFVNNGIRETINSEAKEQFWFLNNGIVLVCEDASLIGTKNDVISVKYPQVVNGQQTLKIIELFSDKDLLDVDIIVRVYVTDNEGFFSDIAFATNSQSRVDFSDISSNKSEQQAIKAVFESYKCYYKNKKGLEKKLFKVGTNSKTLGRISFATINNKPTIGRKTVRDSIIFSEDNYFKLFNVDPLLLLLAFLIYNHCHRRDPGIKKIVSIENEIKHFGYFHLTFLMWRSLEEEIKKREIIIKLIETNSFDVIYNKAYLKLENIIKEEMKKSKGGIVLKDYFNNEDLDKLLLKK